MEISASAWTLIIICIVFVYCNIGYLLAHISWKTWHNIILNKKINYFNNKRKITKYWYAYLIFPMSFYECGGEEVPIDGMKEKQYKRMMMFLWPMKIIYNILSLTIIICQNIGTIIWLLGIPIAIGYVIGLLAIQIGKLFTLPVKKLFKINSV